MKGIIIYGSHYGTTKQYAEELSRLTHLPLENEEDVNNIHDDFIVYLGGLYAGGVKELKHIVKMIPSQTQMIVVTVGLADVQDEQNIKNIRHALQQQLSPELFHGSKFFHLRGGIDYSKLSFKHKTMMTLLYKVTKNKPRENMTAEDQAMVDSYNKKVDFVDFQALKPIVEEINFIMQGESK